MYLLDNGIKLNDIIGLFGVRNTAIREANQRIQKELEADETLMELVVRVMKQASCV